MPNEFALAVLDRRSDTRVEVSYGDDKQLNVEFYAEPTLMEYKSEQAQRAVYEDVVMIKIFEPGKLNPKIMKAQLTDLPSRPSDPHRWPKAWESYQNKTAVVHDGTLLELWAPLTKTDVLNLKAYGIHTVEALAGTPDSALTGDLTPMNRKIRDKAQVWLAAQGDPDVAIKLKAQNDALNRDVLELRKELDEVRKHLKEKKDGSKT